MTVGLVDVGRQRRVPTRRATYLSDCTRAAGATQFEPGLLEAPR